MKHLLSGVFRYAIRIGTLNPPNPVREVCVPEGPDSENTYAYSLEEIVRMLAVLPEPARTIVAVAGFIGLRRGELRGIKLEDYDGQILIVRRSVWRKHIGAPKGKHGAGAVPVMVPLAKMIEQYLLQFGPRSFLFESLLGGPVSVEYIAREVIKPKLQALGHGVARVARVPSRTRYQLACPWRIRHRRPGHLASQRRVSDGQSYIKWTGVDGRSLAAMKALESIICTKHAPRAPNSCSTAQYNDVSK